MKITREQFNEMLNAIGIYRPTFYFDNIKDYNGFIMKVFKEKTDCNKHYSYRGMRIIYWNKNIATLIYNDCILKDIK